MQRRNIFWTVGALVLGLIVGVAGARLGFGSASGGNLADIASERGLTGAEAEAALATFVPPGAHDDYLIFASGGHSGQMHVIGVPSMRLLKTIPVFAPDAWSGYGFGADWSMELLAEGSNPDQNESLTWGDTHHPALSETGGDYDGRFLYINDRANGRIAMIDLRDFKTKQIIDMPNMQSSHGGVFATPDTEYVHISAKTPSPIFLESGYAPLDEYQEHYRGVSGFMAVDPVTGRMDMDRSFQIELPPYNQDLADAGKLASAGWAFINSYNVEMATGGNMEGNPPIETGAIAFDYDYLHIINWELAEQVVAEGKFEMVNGVRMIRLQTAIDEGILWFAPEPRNPHGVDVSPDGNYIVVSGKLDPNATVYSIDRIEAAIAAGDIEGYDPFGVPVLRFDAVVEAQVELGGGPLHTQFDNRGNAYTSLFVESAVARWTLGPEAGVAEGDAFTLVDKIPVHYNIGHLVTAHGDTVAPHGRYLVALNKWAIDRHTPVGTLHPQNFQLIDIDAPELRILRDMPIGFGEPHYVQMIAVDKLADVWTTYPVGTDPLTMATSDVVTMPGEERVERIGDTLHVYMTARRSTFTPDVIRARQGETVVMHITNIETAQDATHGFAIPGYNVQASLDPGEVVTVEIVADRSGSFAFYCTEFCSALHLEMQGWLLIEP
ncbi:MAG TPA: Sec-dependent nitrous-oxide reductase [Acidimicrobiia bacterium]|nr:Sec-dependent nitrous-oxide reductase [Acidimicrobiia bacterium]